MWTYHQESEYWFYRSSQAYRSDTNTLSASTIKENEFMCLVCGSQFADSKSLKSHLKLHDSVIVCDCGQICENMLAYEKHVKRNHEASRACACPVCGKLFMHATSMKRHQLASHSEERPFQCDLCKKSFKRKDVLKQHMGTHKEYQV